MAYFRRASGCDLDREHEHSAGRQQETVSQLRGNNRHVQINEHDIRARRLTSGFPRHGQSLWNGLHGTIRDRMGSPLQVLDEHSSGKDQT